LGRASALHLAEVIKLVGGQFIVETNGMAIGHDPSLLDFLKPLKCHIRRTIKGDDPDTLQKVTGACCGVPPLFDLIVPLNQSAFCVLNYEFIIIIIWNRLATDNGEKASKRRSWFAVEERRLVQLVFL
jgi:uncharacterized Fe-S cluster-containing radical SAM superfamily protein